ncbi:hypothetical protein [Leifsonia shinshuensis]|uniref:Uncharacterized protein n=1 Tax=Leifsonia shinshuensis TaxID=150026 RepID=A0A7G6Y9H2_9MICO|nr:hypothetical protein [Leifsonia shinshuensis]QNE35137.1 hypothetical protein F1C12_08315 [Leifsonia shinshuensis]
MATASPAHATSTPLGSILFDRGTYEVPAGGSIEITGTLQAATGETVPADIALVGAFANGSGYSVEAGPTVSGSTFSLTVSAAAGAGPASLTVSSPNYRSYLAGSVPVSLAPVRAGTIQFGAPSYDIPAGEWATITGTVSHDGGTAPSGFTLSASFSDDTAFRVVSGPVLTGDAFELTVEATQPGEVTGSIQVASSSHPQYAAATASLTALEPGFIEAGFGMVPVTVQWERLTTAPEGSDPNVRWFRPKGNVPIVGPPLNTPWLDLRFHLNDSKTDYQNNFGNPIWGDAYVTGGFPQPWTDLDTKTEVTVKSFTLNGATVNNPAQAIGVVLGQKSVVGDGELRGKAIFKSDSGFLPNVDPLGNPFTQAPQYRKAFHAFVPPGLQPGHQAVVEIVTSLIRKDGSASKIGYIVTYKK